MQAQKLPYDMGNAGDLGKHGLLAEFTRWWCELNNRPFQFIDPFGGRPWLEPPHPQVINRIRQLDDCAINKAQNNIGQRYFGSGHVVKNTAFLSNNKAKILVSDRDPLALSDLLATGLEPINFEKFRAGDAYSILDAEIPDAENSLLLLDPFDEFIQLEATRQLPRINQFITSNSMPVILFLLYADNTTRQRFYTLKSQFIGGQLKQFSIYLPKITTTVIKGESKFASEALFILPENYHNGTIHLFNRRMQYFAVKLTQALECEVVFSRR